MPTLWIPVYVFVMPPPGMATASSPEAARLCEPNVEREKEPIGFIRPLKRGAHPVAIGPRSKGN